MQKLTKPPPELIYTPAYLICITPIIRLGIYRETKANKDFDLKKDEFLNIHRLPDDIFKKSNSSTLIYSSL